MDYSAAAEFLIKAEGEAKGIIYAKDCDLCNGAVCLQLLNIFKILHWDLRLDIAFACLSGCCFRSNFHSLHCCIMTYMRVRCAQREARGGMSYMQTFPEGA